MSGRGRPTTGIRVEVRIPEWLLDDVDTFAARWECNRPEAMRRLLHQGVIAQGRGCGSNISDW